MERWEFMTVKTQLGYTLGGLGAPTLNATELDALLNLHGAQGWRLGSVCAVGTPSNELAVVLQRPVTDRGTRAGS